MKVYRSLQDFYKKDPEEFKRFITSQKENGEKIYEPMSDYYKENPSTVFIRDQRLYKECLHALGSIGMNLRGTILKVDCDEIVLGFSDGQTGLLERQDFAWGRETISLLNFCKVGDKLEVKVIDNRGDKLILGRKHRYSNPFIDVMKEFNVGDKITGVIESITETKLCVAIEEPCIKTSDPYSVAMGEIILTEDMRKKLRPDLKEGLEIKTIIERIDEVGEILILQSNEILNKI